MNRNVVKAVIDTMTSAQDDVRGGTHMNFIMNQIVRDMIDGGYDEDCVFCDKINTTLPSRYSTGKTWDVAAYNNDDLIAAIELKSISSSFGNNVKNRIEEAVGDADDVQLAINNGAFGDSVPNFGYVMLVNKCDDSTHPVKSIVNPRFEADIAYQGASYIERLQESCSRLLADRKYQAVWFAVVDLDKGTVEEPDKNLTYAKFMANMHGWLETAMAQINVSQVMRGRANGVDPPLVVFENKFQMLYLFRIVDTQNSG